MLILFPFSFNLSRLAFIIISFLSSFRHHRNYLRRQFAIPIEIGDKDNRYKQLEVSLPRNDIIISLGRNLVCQREKRRSSTFVVSKANKDPLCLTVSPLLSLSLFLSLRPSYGKNRGVEGAGRGGKKLLTGSLQRDKCTY